MDKPLLHQPLHGYIDPLLRTWLLSMIGTCNLDCHESPVCHVAVTPDGRTAVTTSEDHKIRVWEAPSGICSHTLTGHTAAIRDIKIIPAQNRVLTISEDHTACIWNLAHGVCEHVLTGHTGPIWDARLTPDGKTIITRSADNTARIWDTASGTCTCTIDCTPEILCDAQLTPDGNTAITRSERNRWSAVTTSYVRIWDARTGAYRLGLSFPENVHGEFTIVVSPEGKTIATRQVVQGCKNYQYCQLWDIATGAMQVVLSSDIYSWTEGCENISTHHGDAVRAIVFESENSVILYYDQRACVIDLVTSARREISFDSESTSEQRYNYPDPTNLSTDNQTAVSVSKNHALVWNMPEGTLRHILANPFLRIALPRNSSNCSHTQNVGLISRIWQYSTSWFNKSHDKIVLGAQGNCMASVTADGHTVHVWNIGKQSCADVLAQLSVFQIALLSEIQHRLETGGNRLILRPGSANYCAYQALPPVIKSSIRPCIGIYLPK